MREIVATILVGLLGAIALTRNCPALGCGSQPR